MSWVIYLFGSGLAFFLGMGLLVAALAIFAISKRRWLLGLASVLALIGPIVIGLSATPLPTWFYLTAAFVTFFWLLAELSQRAWFVRHRKKFRLLALALWATAVGMEAPYHFIPRIDLNGQHDLYIIGDSVAAGVSSEETWTWPRLLAESGELKAHDFSRMGATVSSATKKAQQLPERGGIVLLEIGGNDLLGGTPSEKFERDLDVLLARVDAPERTIVMFELPLPPLSNRYGQVQRRLAAKHNVTLIPKRVFMQVLTGKDATLDSLHLSKQGHQDMATAVRTLILAPPEQ